MSSEQENFNNGHNFDGDNLTTTRSLDINTNTYITSNNNNNEMDSGYVSEDGILSRQVTYPTNDLIMEKQMKVDDIGYPTLHNNEFVEQATCERTVEQNLTEEFSPYNELYGFDITYHDGNDNMLIERPEHPYSVIDTCLESIFNIQGIIQKERQHYGNIPTVGDTDHVIISLRTIFRNMNDFMKDLDEKIRLLKTKLVTIDIKLQDKYFNSNNHRGRGNGEYCYKVDKASASYKFHFLESSAIHFRGVFLIMIHTIKECIEVISKTITSRKSIMKFFNSDSAYEKKLTVFNQKFYTFTIVANMGLTFGEERLEHFDEQNSLDFNPFATSINLDDRPELKQVDPIVFYHHIGTFYYPQLASFFKLMVKVTASYGKAFEMQSKLQKEIMFYAASAYYLANPKVAAKDCNSVFVENPIVGGSMWNVQEDNAAIKTFTYLGYSYIETSHKFAIPFPGRKIVDSVGISVDGDDFEFVSVSKDPIKNSIILFDDNNNHKKEKPKVLFEDDDEGESSEEEEKVGETIIYQDNYNNSNESNYESHNQLEDIKLDNNAYPSLAKYYKEMKDTLADHHFQDVGLRLISTAPVDKASFLIERPQDFPYLSQVIKALNTIREKQGTKKFDGTVILHIHGGGFIAMSSFSHEVYLRNWCSATNIPIISVDYRRAPEYKYPVQLEECYAAYCWLIDNCEKILGAPLKKIILAGDSAGGNLVLATTIRAIYEGNRVPDLLIASYPVSFLDFAPSPSRMMALTDPLVNMSFLKLCGTYYCVESDEPGHNPFISTSVVDDKILKRFPPCYFNMGTLDPLFDDGIYMAKRIARNNGGRVKLRIYDGLGHGYLSIIDRVQEAKVANANLCEWILQNMI
ncbi:hypothetical protein ABK040_007233 [Willaertia magna]